MQINFTAWTLELRMVWNLDKQHQWDSEMSTKIHLLMSMIYFRISEVWSSACRHEVTKYEHHLCHVKGCCIYVKRSTGTTILGWGLEHIGYTANILTELQYFCILTAISIRNTWCPIFANFSVKVLPVDPWASSTMGFSIGSPWRAWPKEAIWVKMIESESVQEEVGDIMQNSNRK